MSDSITLGQFKIYIEGKKEQPELHPIFQLNIDFSSDTSDVSTKVMEAIESTNPDCYAGDKNQIVACYLRCHQEKEGIEHIKTIKEKLGEYDKNLDYVILSSSFKIE